MTEESPNLRPRELGARQQLRRPAGSPAIMVAELDPYRADVDSLHGAALSPPTRLDALLKYE